MSDKFEMLANRVKKNARHLGKWAKRESIECWRVYDQDIPELPITVDTYGGTLIVNDYRHTDENGQRGGGDEWLLSATDAAKNAMGAKDAFIKQRERFSHKDGDQYERGGRDVWRTVREGGHQFKVNLGGFIDTGLFLDHRITRAKAAAEKGASLLNLYAYTGAFSIYAAAAGKSTTTVDMSNTYLDWAKENFALNKLDPGELVQADTREFITDARSAGRTWDVIVVDPPTFSNSKRMDYTWDIQRDHSALLDDVLGVLAPGGVIWFSTNRRKFKLDYHPPHPFAVVEQTHLTIPPDFRDGKVHHSYRVSR
ncbi:MAG TPA: class I SAM-dependent methyltransferase [Kofleriaceae bacterium]